MDLENYLTAAGLFLSSCALLLSYFALRISSSRAVSEDRRKLRQDLHECEFDWLFLYHKIDTCIADVRRGHKAGLVSHSDLLSVEGLKEASDFARDRVSECKELRGRIDSSKKKQLSNIAILSDALRTSFNVADRSFSEVQKLADQLASS